MAADGVSPAALAIRSSVGIELWASSGSKQPYEHKSNLPREETKNSRSISFSQDGRYFAYSNGQEVKVLQTNSWQLQCSLPRPKAFYLKFSPRGNYLCTWELYVITKDIPEGSPNMFVYEIATGKQVFSIVQKKQTDWEPSWSADECMFATVIGGETLFYDLSKGVEGFGSTMKKIGGSHGAVISVGPGNSPPFIAVYTPGAKGSPSMCKLYKYPALDQNQTIACKSFYADRVELMWNKRGTGMLLLSSTEVDKTGASYYGNQALHFLNTKGDSCSVPLAKKGPVHCVTWSPKATEFVVVYGYMPSRAALYNLKCDVVFDFDEGPHNCAYFSPFGNIVVLAGFGNLPGNVEIWDVKKKEIVTSIKCPDTTFFQWHPNGEYFVTATTAPRLRIGNGFKVYHYSGALLHETLWPTGQELLAIEWQQFSDNTFEEPTVTKIKQEGIKSSQPEASKKAYTPPHLREGRGGNNGDKVIPQLPSAIPGLPPGYTSSQAKKQGAQKSFAHQQQQNQQQQPNQKGNNRQHNNRNNQKKNNNNEQNNEANGPNNTRARCALNNAGGGGSSGNEAASPHVNKRQTNNAAVNSESYDANTLALKEAANDQHQQRQPNKRNPNNRRQQNQVNQNAKKHPNQQQQTVVLTEAASMENNSGDGEKQHSPKQHQQQQPEQNKVTDHQQQMEQPSKKAANPEKEKKIRNVAKKLSDIKKLKARQEQGEVLELNQHNKIAMESKFLEELKALKLSN